MDELMDGQIKMQMYRYIIYCLTAAIVQKIIIIWLLAVTDSYQLICWSIICMCTYFEKVRNGLLPVAP